MASRPAVLVGPRLLAAAAGDERRDVGELTAQRPRVLVGVEVQRVLALAGSMAVEPEIVASTRLNLGTAFFWQGDYAHATEEYEQALAT